MTTTISQLHSLAVDPTTESFRTTVSKWSNDIRDGLELMGRGDGVSEDILKAPRRKHADPYSAVLANAIAQVLHPGPVDSLAPLIQYEKDIVKLRAYIQDQRNRDLEAVQARRATKDWRKRVALQGPWNETDDPLSLEGSPSLPMPVQIGEVEDFAPFFTHLKAGGDDNIIAGEEAEMKEEPFYNTHMIEFNRGVLYADRRMDLCKMVVGPTHIGDLMDSLETNPFTEHFLLGNNIIGPLGARRIARFVEKYPNRMSTWYLAGNCIDTDSFTTLVDSLTKSSSVTNIWLKRNPLGSASANDLFRLITQAPNLRTLDLDQTSLGDAGVAQLFSQLADHESLASLGLRHIYLNATGVGPKAAEQIARYLANESCTLVSLYLSHNPLGDAGAKALSIGLESNKSLERLALSSCGLKDEGTIQLLSSLSSHTTLRLLDLGQGYATEDLGARYNWLTETIVPQLVTLIEAVPTLRSLTLDYTPMTRQSLNTVLHAVTKFNLLYYFAKSIQPQGRDYDSIKAGQEGARVSLLVKARLEQNVAKEYDGKSYDEFLADERRWLTSPEDVRYIDSVYRNRDAGMARRGLKKLVKLWEEDDDTLERVKHDYLPQPSAAALPAAGPTIDLQMLASTITAALQPQFAALNEKIDALGVKLDSLAANITQLQAAPLQAARSVFIAPLPSHSPSPPLSPVPYVATSNSE